MQHDYESHPAAKLFPMMDGEAMSELAKSIQKHGLIHSVVLHDGQILDGRNRFMACKLAQVEPRFVQWESNGTSPTEWVLATNMARRHLTMGDKIRIGVEALPMLKAEARERQGQRSDIQERIPESDKGQSRDKAAELTGVNPRYISDASKLKETNPEKYQEVIDGKKTLPAAIRETRTTPERSEPDSAPPADPGSHENDSEVLAKLKALWANASMDERTDFEIWISNPQKLAA